MESVRPCNRKFYFVSIFFRVITVIVGVMVLKVKGSNMEKEDVLGLWL